MSIQQTKLLRNGQLAAFAGLFAQTDWDRVQIDVKSLSTEELLQKYPIGHQFVIPWIDADDPDHKTKATAYQAEWNVVHYGNVELEDGSVVPGMFLQMDKCSAYGVQFSAPQAFYHCDSTLPDGTYYVTLNAAYDTIPANSIVQFTLTNVVPAGGRIRLGTDLNVTTWSNSFSSAPRDTVTASIVTTPTGTNLGTTGEGGLNIIARMRYGSNRWSTSAIRQYLNKSGENWWTSQEDFDTPPNQIRRDNDNEPKKGFMTGFDDEFLNAIKPVKVTTALNRAEGYANATEDTFDTFFLPSLQQMNVNPQLANVEGDYFEYWRSRLGLTGYADTGGSNVYDAFKIPDLNANSAQSVRLRSARVDNAYRAWYVSSSGYASTGSPSTAARFSPVCVVC